MSKQKVGGRKSRAETRRAAFRLVRNDLLVSATAMPSPGVPSAMAVGRIKLEKPDRLLWPKEKIRKRDLVAYYRSVAPVLLPYLRDRPQTLYRHPEGLTGGVAFWDGSGHPEWIVSHRGLKEGSPKEVLSLLCQDEPSLVYLVDKGCIELRPWSSRVRHLEHPDYLVFELEGHDVPFPRVVDAALALKRLLSELGASSYPKTAGGDGLDVYVPLGGAYLFAQARRFAETVVHLVQQRLPLWTTVGLSSADCAGKVTLDFHANQRGWPSIAPYSVRALPKAPVSTPLHWDEVTRKLDPSKFTLKTMLKRLEREGDPFSPVLGPGVDLVGCLDRLG